MRVPADDTLMSGEWSSCFSYSGPAFDAGAGGCRCVSGEFESETKGEWNARTLLGFVGSVRESERAWRDNERIADMVDVLVKDLRKAIDYIGRLTAVIEETEAAGTGVLGYIHVTFPRVI